MENCNIALATLRQGDVGGETHHRACLRIRPRLPVNKDNRRVESLQSVR
ncbi:MAG: hypothetical protein N838_25095 [Thiohalocapsa sp. PB-PSB1]|nr:MAG: hypothetical protein N838_25095 [Thiohalocapsa sp. PB-PSB1]